MKSRFVRSISARGMGRACLALLLGFALTLQGCSWFRRGDGPESRAVQVSEEVTAPGQSGIPSARPGDARPPSAPVDSRRPTEVRPSSDRMMVIFFDFDQSGLINTDYALPDERLPIRRVTSRLYRGFCWQNAVLPESVALFNEKRAEIEAALIPSEVSKRRARRVQKLIDRFYKTVNDPQELPEQLLDKCRGPDSLPLRESPGSLGYVKTP